MSALPYLDGETLRALVPMERAVRALEDALRGGLDPEDTPPRPLVEVPAGQLLLMPAVWGAHAGVKVAGVAPGNPSRGLPRIQGTYLLMDGPTLTPLATLDGVALTALRTPAVSALAVRHLAGPDTETMAVFGTGPQAWGHVEAFRAVRPVRSVSVIARDRGKAEVFAARCAAEGLKADVTGDVGRAELVACCTTARVPLFDGRIIADDTTVVAVGSHEPDAREVDDALVARATVVVEARGAALAEAGDLIIPLRNGTITVGHVAGNLRELVTGVVPRAPGPRLFKSVGMAWEDLVVAVTAYEAWTRAR